MGSIVVVVVVVVVFLAAVAFWFLDLGVWGVDDGCGGKEGGEGGCGSGYKFVGGGKGKGSLEDRAELRVVRHGGESCGVDDAFCAWKVGWYVV